MIQGLQLRNLGKLKAADLPTIAPGWYYDAGLGVYYYLYYDATGAMHRIYTDPFTGLQFETLSFHAEKEYEATVIRSDAPINVLQGDTISVSFTFRWKGDARDIVFRFGNCSGVFGGIYDEGDTAEATKHVDASTYARSYSVSSSFVYRATAIDKPHLFILPEGIEYDVVYRNAFTKLVGEFSDLNITSYQKAS